MNIAVILLVIIAVIVVVGTVVLVLYYIQRPQPNNNPVVTPSCEQAAGSGLPDLHNQPCCVVNGQRTLTRVYALLDMLLAPYPTSYIDVCLTYCSTYNPNTQTCTAGNVDGFNKCVAALKPRQCNGAAMPVATDGPTRYYGFRAARPSDCSAGQTWVCSAASA
jgi:hypothetical protein